MPITTTKIACGLALDDVNQIAMEAVDRYREAVFMRTFAVDSNRDRTLLTALYYCQEALFHVDKNVPSANKIVVPGEVGFPGYSHDNSIAFNADEKEQAREYLGKLYQAVSEHLKRAINQNEQVKKWWLSLQKRRFMNRQL